MDEDLTPLDTDVQHMLTTDDNPFSPFTQFNEWLAWDTTRGHHTLDLLGRFVRTSNELSEADQVLATEWAIQEIVELNPYGIHRKVRASDYD